MALPLRLRTSAVRTSQFGQPSPYEVDEGSVAKVFYPVFPPDQHAQQVLDWLAVASR